jgi:Ca2+-binding RTX toxin-like protein
MTSTVITVTQTEYAFQANNDVVEIAAGVSVYDNINFVALVNDYTGVVLLNYGGILSSGGAGVIYSAGSGGYIVNEASGSIAGLTGILTHSAGLAVFNLGSITGTSLAGGAAFETASDASFIVLDNRGTIFGLSAAVADYATSGFDYFTNSGTIEGFTSGIDVNTAAGGVTTIVNSGTIKGGNQSINVTAGHFGQVFLTNTGHMIGDISLESSGANDSNAIYNSGSINGFILLGAGNDLFNGTGGTSGEIFGEAGNDRLIGGPGNDTISGGPGNDTLTGGPGRDQFLFDAALNAFTNVDRITDFTHLVDKIDLTHAIFPAAGPIGHLAAAAFFEGAAAHDATDRIIYNPANGFVTYDSNGNHAGGATHFATLAAHLHLTNADFLVVA